MLLTVHHDWCTEMLAQTLDSWCTLLLLFFTASAKGMLTQKHANTKTACPAARLRWQTFNEKQGYEDRCVLQTGGALAFQKNGPWRLWHFIYWFIDIVLSQHMRAMSVLLRGRAGNVCLGSEGRTETVLHVLRTQAYKVYKKGLQSRSVTASFEGRTGTVLRVLCKQACTFGEDRNCAACVVHTSLHIWGGQELCCVCCAHKLAYLGRTGTVLRALCTQACTFGEDRNCAACVVHTSLHIEPSNYKAHALSKFVERINIELHPVLCT